MKNTMITFVAAITLLITGCDIYMSASVKSVVAEERVFGKVGETIEVNYTINYNDGTSETKVYNLIVTKVRDYVTFGVQEGGDYYELTTYVEDGNLLGKWRDGYNQTMTFTKEYVVLIDGRVFEWTSQGAPKNRIYIIGPEGKFDKSCFINETLQLEYGSFTFNKIE